MCGILEFWESKVFLHSSKRVCGTTRTLKKVVSSKNHDRISFSLSQNNYRLVMRSFVFKGG